MAVEVTEKNYAEAVEKSVLPILVDVWAPWCPPCRAVSPYVEELEQKYAGKINVAKINADDAPELTQKMGVYGLPTLFIFKDGKPVFNVVGLPDHDKLEAAIDSAVK